MEPKTQREKRKLLNCCLCVSTVILRKNRKAFGFLQVMLTQQLDVLVDLLLGSVWVEEDRLEARET